jgi:chemotaxis protein MotD
MNSAIRHDIPPAQPLAGRTVDTRTDGQPPDGDSPGAFGGILSLIEGHYPRLPDSADLDEGGAIASENGAVPLAPASPLAAAMPDLASLVAGATASRMDAGAGGAAGFPGHDPVLSNEGITAYTAKSTPIPAPSPALVSLKDLMPSVQPAVRSGIPATPNATGGTQAMPINASAEIMGAVVTKVERHTHHGLIPSAQSFAPELAWGPAVIAPASTPTASVQVTPETPANPVETQALSLRSNPIQAPSQAAASRHVQSLTSHVMPHDVQHSAAPHMVAQQGAPASAQSEKIAEAAHATAPDPAPTTALSSLTPLQASPTRQIADAIIAGARDPAQAATIPGSAAPATGTASPAPMSMQMLTVRLEPADLGTVTVKLALRAGRLDVAIEAADQRTAQLLRSDGEALSKLLNGAGYGLDNLAILTSVADRGASGVSTAAQTGSYPSGPEGHAPSDQNPQHQRGQPREPQDQRDGSARVGDSARTADAGGVSTGHEPRAGAVYL